MTKASFKLPLASLNLAKTLIRFHLFGHYLILIPTRCLINSCLIGRLVKMCACSGKAYLQERNEGFCHNQLCKRVQLFAKTQSLAEEVETRELFWSPVHHWGKVVSLPGTYCPFLVKLYNSSSPKPMQKAAGFWSNRQCKEEGTCDFRLLPKEKAAF